MGTSNGGGLPGCGASRPIEILKKTYLADMIILNVLCDMTFKRKQPLKYVADQYIKILKNKEIQDVLDEIKTTKEITPCDLYQESEGAVANSVMVELY